MNTEHEQIIQQVDKWLIEVVIGLNLCPFAAKPQKNKQIKTLVSSAGTDEALVKDVYQALLELENTPVEQLETTLLVVPNMLADFDDYLMFSDWVNAIIKSEGWEGIFQLATFHPNYCFYGSEPDDAENLTNRSPYPIFHLIREASMEKALAHYPDPDGIPERNIERVSNLSTEQLRELFDYIR